MSIVSIIPVASMLAANASLDAQGFGPDNYSVPAYAGPGATHGVLHAWADAPLLAALQAIAGAVTQDVQGDPIAATQALITAQGAKWGAQAPALPTSGNALANTLYRYTDGTLWWCIQTFNRSTFSAPPATYPALIQEARVPGTVAPWKQPTDQLDAYKLVNPFTGKPDECTYGGKTWFVSQADGAGNNIWQPGVFGWTQLA